MSYPPDIERKRRRYGLPVTPEEHAAYERGEYREPPATDAQIERTLRAVLPRCSPVFRHALLEIADRMRARNSRREPGEEG